MSEYSKLFSCLYDEKKPVGNLGRGAHYSVFRTAEWKNVILQPLDLAEVHDFAVIWDEDHDTRVIPVIERLYIKGLLSPVQFIGERKGKLTIIAAARLWGHSDKIWADWVQKVTDVGNDADGDYWNVHIGRFDRSTFNGLPHQTDPQGIINDGDERVITYLRNIDNLWRLGTRPYEASSHVRPELYSQMQPVKNEVE